MSKKREQEFVVSDRRRFGSEGDLRTDVAKREDDAPMAAATPPAEKIDETGSSARLVESPKASGKTLDSIFQSKLGAQGAYPEMTFEKVIESLYMSALIQMGAIRQDGETQPQIDIIGARQTIDSVTVLQEKTKGNLNERENTLL